MCVCVCALICVHLINRGFFFYYILLFFPFLTPRVKNNASQPEEKTPVCFVYYLLYSIKCVCRENSIYKEKKKKKKRTHDQSLLLDPLTIVSFSAAGSGTSHFSSEDASVDMVLWLISMGGSECAEGSGDLVNCGTITLE